MWASGLILPHSEIQHKVTWHLAAVCIPCCEPRLSWDKNRGRWLITYPLKRTCDFEFFIMIIYVFVLCTSAKAREQSSRARFSPSTMWFLVHRLGPKRLCLLSISVTRACDLVGKTGWSSQCSLLRSSSVPLCLWTQLLWVLTDNSSHHPVLYICP